jgi:hypothetical protein
MRVISSYRFVCGYTDLPTQAEEPTRQPRPHLAHQPYMYALNIGPLLNNSFLLVLPSQEETV